MSTPSTAEGAAKGLFCGREWTLHKDKTEADYTILYIGEEGITFTNIMMCYNTSKVIS
jgi:hypothetical protein